MHVTLLIDIVLRLMCIVKILLLFCVCMDRLWFTGKTDVGLEYVWNTEVLLWELKLNLHTNGLIAMHAGTKKTSFLPWNSQL